MIRAESLTQYEGLPGMQSRGRFSKQYRVDPYAPSKFPTVEDVRDLLAPPTDLTCSTGIGVVWPRLRDRFFPGAGK